MEEGQAYAVIVVSFTHTSVVVVVTHYSGQPPSDELHESSPFATELNASCSRKSMSSLPSTSDEKNQMRRRGAEAVVFRRRDVLSSSGVSYVFVSTDRRGHRTRP
jgi:hypothetical protein